MGHQRTLKRSVHCEGVGLHTGRQVRMTLLPAPAGSGVAFVRTDLPRPVTVRVHPENVVDTHHATTLGVDGVRVRTVEHLLAACAGVGLDNVRVELTAEEVPAMDGSALPFVELVRTAGLKRQLAPRTYLRIAQRIAVEEGSRSIQIVPSEQFRVIYTMHFDHPLLGEQSVGLTLSRESFAKEVAAARTYGFLKDVTRLRSLGLAQGGSLENAIVIGDDGVPLGALRYPDELVRHKVLDLLGDLFLLGKPLVGTVIAQGAGHLLHIRLVQEIHRQLTASATSPARAQAVEEWIPPLLPTPGSLEVASI